ncbi:hypothetical protein [Nocardioides marmoraquaticus]
MRADRCDEPSHRPWRRIAWFMALLWAVKPWWPNAKGKLADAGIRVCKSCGCTDDAACDPPCWWVERYLCSACSPDARPAGWWHGA